MKPRLSHSQLEMYWRCAEQYRRRYIEHEKLLPGIALIQGHAIHGEAEFNFRQKLESHIDLPKHELIDKALFEFENQVAGGYVLNSEENNRGASIVIGEAKDLTVKLAKVHATSQAPQYQPKLIEHKVKLELKNATHDLETITDLIDDKERITDFKTAKRSMPQTSIDNSTQLTIYSAARYSETGNLPTEVRFDNLIKTKKPKRQLLISTRTMRDLNVLANRINVTLAAINAGSFPPCPAGSWQCSSKWCGYWYSCPFVNSERMAFSEGE